MSVSVKRGGSRSFQLTDISDPDGSWLLNLGNLKDTTTKDVFIYQMGDSAIILAQGGTRGAGECRTVVSGSSPQNAGTIILHIPNYICGDADGEGTVNISDAVFLVNYIFADGAAPSPLASGDADCDQEIDIADVVYLVNYIFAGGPAPCAGCR